MIDFFQYAGKLYNPENKENDGPRSIFDNVSDESETSDADIFM